MEYQTTIKKYYKKTNIINTKKSKKMKRVRKVSKKYQKFKGGGKSVRSKRGSTKNKSVRRGSQIGRNVRTSGESTKAEAEATRLEAERVARAEAAQAVRAAVAAGAAGAPKQAPKQVAIAPRAAAGAAALRAPVEAAAKAKQIKLIRIKRTHDIFELRDQEIKETDPEVKNAITARISELEKARLYEIPAAAARAAGAVKATVRRPKGEKKINRISNDPFGKKALKRTKQLILDMKKTPNRITPEQLAHFKKIGKALKITTGKGPGKKSRKILNSTNPSNIPEQIKIIQKIIKPYLKKTKMDRSIRKSLQRANSILGNGKNGVLRTVTMNSRGRIIQS